ncbi:hypothetical protein RCL1_003494 [Eukaryota sp. TZLM3-RCL]
MQQEPPVKKSRQEDSPSSPLPSFSSHPAHPLSLSSTLLGLCFYQCLNLECCPQKDDMYGKNRDILEILLTLCKYSRVSSCFKEIIRNSVSHWIRNNQASIDLRTLITRKKSLVERLDINHPPAAVSVVIDERQFILYLNGKRAIGFLSKAIDPDYIESLTVTMAKSKPIDMTKLHFPFVNLQSLSISCCLLEAVSKCIIPQLKKLTLTHPFKKKLQVFVFTSSFSSLWELHVNVSQLNTNLDVSNLVNLSVLNMERLWDSFVPCFIGIDKLEKLTRIRTPSLSAMYVHPNAVITCWHHDVKEPLLMLPCEQYVTDLSLFGAIPVNYFQADIRPQCATYISQFKCLQRLHLESLKVDIIDFKDFLLLEELHLRYVEIERVIFRSDSPLHTLKIQGIGTQEKPVQIEGSACLLRLTDLHVFNCLWFTPESDHKLLLSNAVSIYVDALVLNEVDIIPQVRKATILRLGENYCGQCPFMPLVHSLSLNCASSPFLKSLSQEKVPKLTTLQLFPPKLLNNSEDCISTLPSLQFLILSLSSEFTSWNKFVNIRHLVVTSLSLPSFALLVDSDVNVVALELKFVDNSRLNLDLFKQLFCKLTRMSRLALVLLGFMLSEKQDTKAIQEEIVALLPNVSVVFGGSLRHIFSSKSSSLYIL